MSILVNSAKISHRKSSSTSTHIKQYRGTKRIEPLSKDFFTKLLHFETDFNKKQYDINTLDELIRFYVKAVEYYDSIKDEISSYFMFKIQDILATKKSLKMLIEGSITTRNERDDIAEANIDLKKNQEELVVKTQNPGLFCISDDESVEEDQNIGEPQERRNTKNMDKDKISISMMKNQKQKFVNFFHKMEIHKVSERINLHSLLTKFHDVSGVNDGCIKKDVDSQRDNLRKRLDKRRMNNFPTYNINQSHSGDTFVLNFDDTPDRKNNLELRSIREQLNSFLDIEKIDLPVIESSFDQSFTEKKEFTSFSSLKDLSLEQTPTKKEETKEKKLRYKNRRNNVNPLKENWNSLQFGHQPNQISQKNDYGRKNFESQYFY